MQNSMYAGLLPWRYDPGCSGLIQCSGLDVWGLGCEISKQSRVEGRQARSSCFWAPVGESSDLADWFLAALHGLCRLPKAEPAVETKLSFGWGGVHGATSCSDLRVTGSTLGELVIGVLPGNVGLALWDPGVGLGQCRVVCGQCGSPHLTALGLQAC